MTNADASGKVKTGARGAPGDPSEVEGLDRQMRAVMGHFATGISVVTARRLDGSPVGTTVNAVSSVSLKPPLVLVCLAENSETLDAIREVGRFGINVLSVDQRTHSDRFAAKGADSRAHEIEYEDHSLGIPTLPDSLATIGCELEATHSGGDHEIVVGLVRSLARSEAPSVRPLIFYQGSYSWLGEQVKTVVS